MKKLFKFNAIIALMFSMLACQSQNKKDTAYEASNVMEAPSEERNDYAEFESDSVAEMVSEQMKTITGDKLVYHGSVEIQTLKYDESTKQLIDLIKTYNGIISYEYESDHNYRWYYDDDSGTKTLSLEVRIPTDQFSSFLDDINDIGKVLHKNTSVENITKQYNNRSIQIEALTKQETRLLEMLDQATTIEDMILIEERLTDVQTELNLLQADKAEMDTDIQYSTISIELEEVKEYLQHNKGFSTRFKEALLNSWKDFIYGIGEFCIAIVYHLPSILLFGAILWIIIKISKKSSLFSKVKDKTKSIFHKTE